MKKSPVNREWACPSRPARFAGPVRWCSRRSQDAPRRRRQQLKEAIRDLINYVHRLNGLAARKRLSGLRQEFIAAGEPIEADLKSLKRAVPCPAGRAVPAACRPEIAYTGGGPVRWAGEADMGGARCPATVGHAGVLVMSDLVGRLLGRRGWERPPASSSSGQ